LRCQNGLIALCCLYSFWFVRAMRASIFGNYVTRFPRKVTKNILNYLRRTSTTSIHATKVHKWFYSDLYTSISPAKAYYSTANPEFLPVCVKYGRPWHRVLTMVIPSPVHLSVKTSCGLIFESHGIGRFGSQWTVCLQGRTGCSQSDDCHHYYNYY
jgi:hypothetical protein